MSEKAKAIRPAQSATGEVASDNLFSRNSKFGIVSLQVVEDQRVLYL